MAGKRDGGSHERMSAGFPTGSSGQTEKQAEGLKESAQEMASHLGETAGQVRDKAREFVSSAASQAQETWRSAREGLQERVSNFSASAGDIWEDGIDFVRRYPVASVAVAFGIGCLASCAFFGLSRSTGDVTNRMSRASS
ncbi:MAG TPA: hypothetical protein VH592_10850 [Gemmataceae bacterium]|jgi:ElaB/YqjD/DUF883 family membrane-anchored ribosome-binding protein